MTSVQVGYAAMLEQFAPTEAIALATRAEAGGFGGVIVGDHYQPGLPQQGQAGHMWSVLGALGAHVSRSLGGITTPTFRTHPAIVAQAAATLAQLYGSRYWLGIGSGEAINEHILGTYWPEAPERISRMFEAIEVIQKLFASRNRDIRHSGRHFTVEATRLWTMPETLPALVVATSGPVTARRAGRLTDGIITMESRPAHLESLLGRFAQGARESGRDPEQLERMIQVHVSWAPTDAEALENALTEWPNGGLKFSVADVRSPFDLAQMVRQVGPEDLQERLLVAADPQRHIDHLQRFADLGFSRIYVHNVGRNQQEFIDTYASHVLPALHR